MRPLPGEAEVVEASAIPEDRMTNQAEAAVNKKIREDFLSLAQRWLKLAGGYERSLRSQTGMGKQEHSFLE